MTRRVTNFRPAIACIATSLFLATTGCGGGSMTSELTVRPTARPVAAAEAKPLRLPADEKFSIALAPAQKTPGLMGTADAVASASADGNAEITALAETAGNASATFQVGHAFANDSTRQIDLTCRLRMNYEYRAASKSAIETQDAILSLAVFARDSRGRLLKTVNVLQDDTADGGVSSKDRKEVEFTVTLGPGESASIFVGGNVTVDVKDGRSASGAIRLNGLEMEVQSKAAPAVAPSATTQPRGGG